MTPTSEFLSVLHTGPLLAGDVIVVLCGEDAEARVRTGYGLLQQGAAPRLLLSGGRSEPPAILGAHAMAAKLVGMGLAPDRVLLETESQHTAEQAANVLRLATGEEWGRLLLVASAYHLPRAFLTFVRALGQAAVPVPGGDGEGETQLLTDRIHILPVAAYAPWGQCPPGRDRTRRELARVDWCKVATYGDDVATVEEGLAYLERWEGR